MTPPGMAVEQVWLTTAEGERGRARPGGMAGSRGPSL